MKGRIGWEETLEKWMNVVGMCGNVDGVTGYFEMTIEIDDVDVCV